MILKIIFLIMLCIPVGCILIFLMIDTAKDIPKAKQGKKSNDKLEASTYRRTRHFRIAK